MKYLVIITLFYFILPLQTIGQWLPVKADTSFKVYLHKDWKENRSYKAEGRYQVPIDTLYRFLTDFSGYTRWINYCTEVDLLYANKDKHYIYFAFYDLPWPLSNRKSISEMKITIHENGIIQVDSAPIDLEYETHSRATLVNRYREKFELIPIDKNSVLFRMQGSYYPGGFIPDWIIKKFLSEGPYDVLQNIKKEVEKGDEICNTSTH